MKLPSEIAAPRSAGARASRRPRQPWPADRDFRILSIDGGGIRGIYPARVLAELEERYCAGRPIAEHFDLITGTSTGGIIALGLGLGIGPAQLAQMYETRGREIFPPSAPTFRGTIERALGWVRDKYRYRYERDVLRGVLESTFGNARLGDSRVRLCIPAAEGHHGEVYIFKTPHHADYQRDLHESAVTVACATAAAPTFFQPLDSGGYRFVDGGIWANNPIMIGVIDALSCFEVPRERVRVLSLGNGDERYRVQSSHMKHGGQIQWLQVIDAAMSLQAQNALGQARLLLGPENILRAAPPDMESPIALDDWTRATAELPSLALQAVDELGPRIQADFLCAVEPGRSWP
jgi:patatin-like phospholipase/acyl hydrolase